METVPFSQSFKDDRMTTWRSPRHSMQLSEHLPWRKVMFRKCNARFLHCAELISPCGNRFISCSGPGETPSVEFSPAHARSAVHRISVSFRQPGPVEGRRATNRAVWAPGSIESSFNDIYLKGRIVCGVLRVFLGTLRCLRPRLATGPIWREQKHGVVGLVCDRVPRARLHLKSVWF